MKAIIHKSITEVDEGRWDAIVGEGRILCTHRYAQALEKSAVNGGRCYYIAVYEGAELIAHAPVYFVRNELDIFARGAARKLIGLGRRRWKDFFVLKSLECGPPIALGNLLSFKSGVDRPAALALVCREIELLAKELGVKFILFRDFYDDEAGLYGPLEARGYKKLHNLPQALLKLKWKSFDEYLDSMRSNYRCKIVKSIDKCAKAGISIQPLKELSDDNIRDLKRLYDNVYDNAKEIKRDRLPESFFRNISKCLGQNAIVLAATKDGKLIGYMLSLISGKTLITVFPGLDYDCNKECYVYFNLFYKSIAWAIENGMTDVDMGITTLNPKRDMGSDVVALNMYMKHSNPLFNKIIPTLFDMITPPDTTVARNVFKEGS